MNEEIELIVSLQVFGRYILRGKKGLTASVAGGFPAHIDA
jgi:hypothetical protein